MPLTSNSRKRRRTTRRWWHRGRCRTQPASRACPHPSRDYRSEHRMPAVRPEPQGQHHIDMSCQKTNVKPAVARTQLSVETLLAELPAMTVVRPVELIGRTFPAGQARHVLLETNSLTPQTLGVQVVSGPAALSPAGLRTPRSVSSRPRPTLT